MHPVIKPAGENHHEPGFRFDANRITKQVAWSRHHFGPATRIEELELTTRWLIARRSSRIDVVNPGPGAMSMDMRSVVAAFLAQIDPAYDLELSLKAPRSRGRLNHFLDCTRDPFVQHSDLGQGPAQQVISRSPTAQVTFSNARIRFRGFQYR